MVDYKDSEEPRFWDTVRQDIHRGDLRRTLTRDFAELKEFYLDRDRRKRLENMRRLKRWFFTIIWLFQILILRLSSARRLLLLLAIILPFVQIGGGTNSDGMFILGGAILLFIIMLELKDKLLAHREISQGRLIQQALMPQSSPKVPGWELWLFTRPANDVGGDLVDFIRIDKKRVGLMLADVSGKGLGAALLMAKLQATLKAIAPDYKSLNQLADRINQIFYRDTLRSSFASLVYLELESKSGRIRFVNAGHFPPVKLPGNGIAELPKGGQAIGLSSESTHKTQEVSLQKGDLLLVFSDGLTEAMNTQGEFFGEQRLFDFLERTEISSAQQLGERLIKEVDRFIGEARRNDDLSMIALRFVG